MPASWSRPPLIFVADDDLAMLELVASTLAEQGYEVRRARDGRELLDRLLEHRTGPALAPALVVTDVAMPELHGPAVCTAARDAGVHVPFIFMTAFVSSGARGAAEAAGAVAILDKPFDMDELVDTVRRHLGR